MKYNLSKIMLKAWKVYRKTKNISFAEALHRAWLSAKAEEINAKRIEDAKHAAGITEETNTFAKWKELGYKVKHGASALFGCSLIWGSRVAALVRAFLLNCFYLRLSKETGFVCCPVSSASPDQRTSE